MQNQHFITSEIKNDAVFNCENYVFENLPDENVNCLKIVRLGCQRFSVVMYWKGKTLDRIHNINTMYFSDDNFIHKKIQNISECQDEQVLDALNFTTAFSGNLLLRIEVNVCNNCTKTMHQQMPVLLMKKCHPERPISDECWKLIYKSETISFNFNKVELNGKAYFAIYLQDLSGNYDSDDDSDCDDDEYPSVQSIPIGVKRGNKMLPASNIFHFDYRYPDYQCHHPKSHTTKRVYIINFLNNGVKSLADLRKFILRGPTRFEKASRTTNPTIIFSRPFNDGLCREIRIMAYYRTSLDRRVIL